MRRTVLVALGVLAALTVASPAQAASNVDTAKEALKTSPVYVAPGAVTGGIKAAIALKGQINDGDNIAIVILPEGAAAETQNDPDVFAQQLDDATGHRFTVGVMIGTKPAASSSLLPSGVASDLMSRAASVSTNPTETLITFIGNVQDWAARHPTQVKEPSTATTPSSKQVGSGIPGFVIFAVVLMALSFAFMGVLFLWNSQKRPDRELKLADPPRKIPGLVDQVRQRIHQVHDPAAQESLKEACDRMSELLLTLNEDVSEHDVEMPSKRFTEQEIERATERFEDRLNILIETIDQYVHIQNFPNLYNGKADVHLAEGAKGFAEFDERVLKAIREANEGKLFDFKVNTRILEETPY